ncbi:MAG: hypothetical protein ACXWF4_11130, partial [Candidatus Aminicenantales bacterium]
MPDDAGSTLLGGYGPPRGQGTAWEPDHVVDTYDYRDERDDLFYQVLRIEEPGKKKTFRQRQPDGNRTATGRQPDGNRTATGRQPDG